MAQSADRERTRLQDTADKMERMLRERHESQIASEQAVRRADVNPAFLVNGGRVNAPLVADCLRTVCVCMSSSIRLLACWCQYLC